MIINDLSIPSSYFTDNERHLIGKWYLTIFHGELVNNNTQYILTQSNYRINVNSYYETVTLYDKDILSGGILVNLIGFSFIIVTSLFLGYIIKTKKYKNWYFVIRKIQRKNYEAKYIEIENFQLF